MIIFSVFTFSLNLYWKSALPPVSACPVSPGLGPAGCRPARTFPPRLRWSSRGQGWAGCCLGYPDWCSPGSEFNTHSFTGRENMERIKRWSLQCWTLPGRRGKGRGDRGPWWTSRRGGSPSPGWGSPSSLPASLRQSGRRMPSCRSQGLPSSPPGWWRIPRYQLTASRPERSSLAPGRPCCPVRTSR